MRPCENRRPGRSGPGRSWILACLLTIAAASSVRGDDVPSRALRDWQYYNNTGWLAFRRNELALAEHRFQRAIETIRPFAAESAALLARSYSDLAWVLYKEDRFAEAQPLAVWALTVRDKLPKTKTEAICQSLYSLALIHRGQRHYREAEPLLERALAIHEASLGGAEHPAAAVILDVLAGIYRDQGKYDEAEPLYKRALAIRERYYPDENLQLAESLEHYVVYLRPIKRDEETKEFLDRARAIREAVASRASRTTATRRSGVRFQELN